MENVMGCFVPFLRDLQAIITPLDNHKVIGRWEMHNLNKWQKKRKSWKLMKISHTKGALLGKISEKMDFEHKIFPKTEFSQIWRPYPDKRINGF